MMEEEVTLYKNVCPRNCFSTCSMITHVKAGKVVKVVGDPSHGFTKGKLCAKGYGYSQYVNSPERLKYPLMQTKRGSGNWQRITWDEAYDIISEKMVALRNRHGSNQSLAYNKFSGNLGLLHFAIEGLFESFGSHTKPVGNPCLGTGRQALKYNLPFEYSPPPEEMAYAKLVVIWGSNPARTNIQQMKFIHAARDQGAKLIVIDPIFTETAKVADMYIQIRPGTDGLLAMGLTKRLVDSALVEEWELRKQISGWDHYADILRNLDMKEVCEETGVCEEAIAELTSLYGTRTPVATWIGYGLQRRKMSVQNVRAIDALVTVSGNRFIKRGGLYYFHPEVENMPLKILKDNNQKNEQNREVNINHFASELLKLDDPPVEFLWIHSRNPLSQDQNIREWDRLMSQLEMVVVSDVTMSHTAKMADIVLPATTQFEEMDLHVSYWNHWLSYNQKAIEPVYEAKSDLQVARELAMKLNEKQPGFSRFPVELEAKDWIEKEVTDEVKENYSIKSWQDLIEKPAHFRSQFEEFQQILKAKPKPFTFFSKKAVEDGLSPFPIYQRDRENANHPFLLLTPQSLLKLHSQFGQVDWFEAYESSFDIKINREVGKQIGVETGDVLVVYNEQGDMEGLVELDASTPKNVVIMNQAGKEPVNALISTRLESYPGKESPELSSPFFDIYVSLRKGGVRR
ncbi:molybdopterin-dependent oxidoreductase [Salipaludibacillus daqingensis]|uniref:molybdopterin-dependent oxidoreductase n=1 Tax=Salipaludibacillus daqingensis TaxID=3041001 RepID=UPI00247710A5|nr:molybdopterin-dependent oxidoreductase [Salipaludibacillus daqingensis]